MTRMLLLSLILLVAIPLFMVVSGQAQLGRDYRRADRSSAGIAPPAESTPEAVVQVYAARALNWRGIFGVHTWIATSNLRMQPSTHCIRSSVGAPTAVYPLWFPPLAFRTVDGSAMNQSWSVTCVARLRQSHSEDHRSCCKLPLP